MCSVLDGCGWMDGCAMAAGGAPYVLFSIYIYIFFFRICCSGDREWMILNWCCVLGGWRDECYVLTYVVSDMDIHYTHIGRVRGRGRGRGEGSVE